MWECSNCKNEVVDNLNYCYNCGTKRGVVNNQDNNEKIQYNFEALKRYESGQKKIPNKYHALNTIISILKIFGWVSVLLYVAFGLSLSQGLGVSENMKPRIFIISLVVGILILISFYAIAESIKVILDIEKNSRKSENNSQTIINLLIETNKLLENKNNL
ncbi:MAG: zinc ribbon domain-containing protein [Vallitalea sp.]|nr:zinc ribbon domain-containing protein [Vallitalea sp.]